MPPKGLADDATQEDDGEGSQYHSCEEGVSCWALDGHWRDTDRMLAVTSITDRNKTGILEYMNFAWIPPRVLLRTHFSDSSLITWQMTAVLLPSVLF